jgi:hypothetical protein
VPPAPPLLELVDVLTIVGRGTVITIRSDAPVDASPPFVLEILVRQTGRPGRPFPFPLPGRPATIRASFPLGDIPDRPVPFTPAREIQAVRTNGTPPFEYQVLLRVQPPFAARLAIVAPDGARAAVDVSVP